MKVYVLTFDIAYEGSNIEAVFSSKQAAEDYKVKHHLKDDEGNAVYTITEFELIEGDL